MKSDPATNKRYYKILKDGRSFNGGMLTWSLPRNGKPGEWHAVEGTLVQCRNGLHLTNEPTYRRMPGSICYEAEFEGETIGPFGGNELVVRKCRLVRRVAWSKFNSEDEPEPEVPAVPKDSPALALLRHVWGSIDYRSHRIANEAMQTALKLAIESGMEFGADDFGAFAKNFRSSYWINIEGSYSRACEGSHGPNASAIKAIESYLGRKPFIVADEPLPKANRIRLCVGRRFSWHDQLKARVHVEVTSFADDQTHLIACSYKEQEKGSYEKKIDRRFKITHDDIAEYHKAIRDHEKKKEQEEEERAIERSTETTPCP